MTDERNPPTNITPTSPAHHREPVEGKTSLRELPWCAKINLRGDPNNARFMSAAAEALGVALPTEPNTTATAKTGTETDDATVFWLGPDEWLLHCNLARADTVLQQLQQKLAPLHHAATDVTDYYTVLELSGKDAAATLARGCPLDLHERVFKATHCAQTRFGNAGVLLYKPGAEPDFQIQVRWSFAVYVWDYLAKVIDSL